MAASVTYFPSSGSKDRPLSTCSSVNNLCFDRKIVLRGGKTQLCTSLNSRWNILKGVPLLPSGMQDLRMWQGNAGRRDSFFLCFLKCSLNRREADSLAFSPFSISFSLPMIWESPRPFSGYHMLRVNGNRMKMSFGLHTPWQGEGRE